MGQHFSPSPTVDTSVRFLTETVFDHQGMSGTRHTYFFFDNLHARFNISAGFAYKYFRFDRYYVTKDNIMYMASEVGVVDLAPDNVVQKVSKYQVV